MRARSIRIVFSFAAALAGAACNELTGAGDLATSAEDGGAPAEASSVEPPVDASTGGEGEMDAPGPTVVPSCDCVAAPPPGWIGPVALFREDAPEPAPCPGGLTTAMSGGTDPEAPEPGCEPCACTLTGACATATVQSYASGGCSSSCGSAFNAVVGTTCTRLSYCVPATTVKVTASARGSCTASGGARRPAGWKQSVTACTFSDGTDGGITAPADAGCDVGLACAPAIAGSSAPTCIVHEGEATCPDGPYSVRLTFGGSISDTRTCSPCTCGTAQATCEGGEVTVYHDDECTSVATKIGIPPTCGAFTTGDATGGAKITKPASLVDGGCPPSGGVVTGGTVTAGAPWTACCLP